MRGKATSAPGTPLLRYGIAVMSVAAALGLRLLLEPIIVQETPFRLIVGAVVVSAWYGGLGPGLLATVVGGLITDYFFLPPINSLSGLSTESVPLMLFLLEGLLITGIVVGLRHARQRAEASTREAREHQERLRQSEQKIRDLVGRILAAVEEERRRVAYEVHDGFTQMAIAAYQLLQNFADDYPQASAKATEELDVVIDRLEQTIKEARHVIADLRPTALDDLGLAAALRQHVDTICADEGVEVSYEEALGEERLPPRVETALFRIAQEALANACKHAGTERAHVALERVGGSVRLRVRDWGCGFRPTEETDGGGPGERVGLSSMRERVALLEGALELRSEPGSGTLVEVKIPLPAGEEETGHRG
jgi:signal transduction histidine kinase